MGVVQQLAKRHGLPVDLVVAGHTHEYYVRNCTGMPDCNAGEQAPLVIVGGAGYGDDEEAPGDAGKERGQQCSRAPYGYVELGFGDDALEVSFRGVAGTGSKDYDTASCLVLQEPKDPTTTGEPEEEPAEKASASGPASWWPRFTADDACGLAMRAIFDTDRCSPASFSVRKGDGPSVRLV